MLSRWRESVFSSQGIFSHHMLLSLRRQQLRQWDGEGWDAYFWPLHCLAFSRNQTKLLYFYPPRDGSEFRGRDNRETRALTFSASCHHQEKRNSHPKCQWQCVYRAVWKELEGHQQFSTDCGSKQDILDTLTILDASNLFEPAPESCPHLQCSAVEQNLSHLSRKRWSNRETKLRNSMALLSAPVQVQGDSRKGPHAEESTLLWKLNPAHVALQHFFIF